MLPLLEAVAARVAQRTGVATTPDEVLISAGATGGLCAAMGALLDPGDEVLILAPYWPLIPGVVRCARGTPVVVPFIGNVDSAEGAVETVKRHVSPRTAALYMSTPNNPTGAVLPRAWIEALVSWAAVEGLWVVSDEVYEDYVYRGEHVYCRQLAPERTISAHSFSKAFGMAGNRCGWIVGPAALMRDMCKVSTHAFYSTPTASQVAGCRALDGRGDAWIERARTSYRQVGEAAAARLGLPPPEGSTFLFWDVAAHLDERGLAGLLERCADRGLILAPGPSFGPYPTHVRLCFTSSPPDVVARGVELLAEMLNLPPRA
jgi:N-succinyldiaminopimelate aminotransferase